MCGSAHVIVVYHNDVLGIEVDAEGVLIFARHPRGPEDFVILPHVHRRFSHHFNWQTSFVQDGLVIQNPVQNSAGEFELIVFLFEILLGPDDPRAGVDHNGVPVRQVSCV